MEWISREGYKMKKDTAIITGRAERLLANKRHHFLNPWFDDIFDSRWSDDFFIEDISSFDEVGRFTIHTNDIDEVRNDYAVENIDLPGNYSRSHFE